MKPIDFAKAAADAAAVLALNVLASVLVMLVYAVVVSPGRPREYYDAAALRIAPWCSHVAGTALFFAAGYLGAGRRTRRGGLWFAASATAFYAVIDAASVGFAGVFEPEFAVSMSVKLAAAAAGAALAAPRPSGHASGDGP